ncbi:MAG: PASTA domain-containing protein [Bacteroidota bacterium]|nr:PASTA domain-containing protein [Bacteroidota bacterium]
MKKIIRTYLTSRPLWFNVIIGFILLFLLILVFMLSLNWITLHGVARNVPALTGKTLVEATNILDEQGFDIVVQDSVYYDSLPPTVIMKQVPEADAVVKVNRTVYVTINRLLPPDVEMPNVVGYSIRNAEMLLKNAGLKVGDTSFKPDFAKNSVLEQIYNGQQIAAGTKIRTGSSISLVLGTGLGTESMSVPRLLGLTFSEAKILMDASGLILGAVIADPTVTDRENAFVYRQNPQSRDEQGRQFRIRPGQMMDVWLSVDKPNVDSLERARRAPVQESVDNDY